MGAAELRVGPSSSQHQGSDAFALHAENPASVRLQVQVAARRVRNAGNLLGASGPEEGATLYAAVLSVARRGADDDVVYSDRPLLGFATDGVHYYRPCDEEARLRSLRTARANAARLVAPERGTVAPAHTAFYIACVEDTPIRLSEWRRGSFSSTT